MKRNKFKRALHHLNKKNVVESAPTNSTLGVFNVSPSGVGPVGWTDRTFTTDISGNPLPKLSVADFTVGENPSNATEAQDTSGLFEDDGTIKTLTPPGDNSYILGPFSSMWYAWGNFTTLGYIRQADRKMVNLGTITGKLSDWDGSSINSYGQLTLEQALWFKDVKKFGDIDNDPANHNYRAFYPGPPSNTPDANGRYRCVIAASREAGGEETRPAPPVNPTQPGEMGADDNFSALSAKNKGLLGVLDRLSGNFGDRVKQGLQLGLNIARGITDNVRFSGDYMFKGLPKNVTEYLPDFKGAGPQWLGGKKITDLPVLKQLLGRDVQYFTPDLDTSIKYAGKNGKVVVVPRTEGVRGWKNWLGSKVSRGFDPSKGVEQIVKTSDTVAAKNLTKVIDLSEPGAKTTLQNLAKKGATNNKVLSKLGKAIPFLNAGLVTADVTNRIRKGDYAGALLGATQIIPGPIGWIGLAAQVTYDVTGSKNNIPWNRQVRESIGDEMDNGGLGQALIDLGLPDNKEDFAKEIAFYYSLNEGIDPQLLHMLVLAITGEEMSEEQKNWIKDNIPNLTKGLADRITKLRGGKVSGKKQVKESFNCGKKNLLREIVIPEAKKKYKVKPKVLGHPSNNTLSDQMKDTTPNVAFKKELPVWSMNQKMRNERSSQEKKNEVLEYLGSSGDHWNYMTKTIKEHNKKIINLNYGGKKKVTRKEQVDKDTLVFMEDEDGSKSNMLQSKINEMQAESGDKEMFAKYYEMNPEKKSLFKEVVKRGVFDYPKKPSKKGYPDKEPAQLDPKTGMHPEYGKKYKHDKLDPHSAESMPMQGDPEIDANIAKNVDQEKKKRKSKILSQPNG